MWNKLWKWLRSSEVAAFISKYDFAIKVYVVMLAFVFMFLIHQFFAIDCFHLVMWLFLVVFFGAIYWILYLVDPNVEYVKDGRGYPLTLKNKIYQIILSILVIIPTFYYFYQRIVADINRFYR